MQLQASTHKHTDHIDVEQRGKDRRGSKTSKAKNLQEEKKVRGSGGLLPRVRYRTHAPVMMGTFPIEPSTLNNRFHIDADATFAPRPPDFTATVVFY